MSNAGTNPDPLALDDVRQSIDLVASAADELEQHRRWFRRYVAEERKRRRLHDRRMRRQAALIEWRERRRRLVQSMQRAGSAARIATRVGIDRLGSFGAATVVVGRRTAEQAQMFANAAFASGARGVRLARAKSRDVALAGVAAGIAGAGWTYHKADAGLLAARKGIAVGRDWTEARRSVLMPMLRDSRRVLGDVSQACLAASAMHADAYRRQAALLAASVPSHSARVMERARQASREASRWFALSQTRARIALMRSWHRAKSAVELRLRITRTDPRAEPPTALVAPKHEIAPTRRTELACVEPWRSRLPAVLTRQPPREMRAPH